jgi:hypothetical protein
MRRMRGFLVLLVLAGACTERIVVREEEFSWEQAQMVWPSRGGIVSPFEDSRRTNHKGADIAGRPGEPVVAALDGVVSYVGAIPGYGNVVAVSHRLSLTTVYAHLGQVKVKRGDSVARGQPIGQMGPSGYIHFEVRRSKEALDPGRFCAVAPSPIPGGSVAVERLGEEPPGVESLPPTETASAQPLAPPPAPAVVVAPPPPAPPPVAKIEKARERPIPPPTPRPTLAPTPRPTPAPTRAAAPPPRARAEQATPTAAPGEEPTGGAAEGPSAGTIALAIGANLFYMPAKLVYAGLGAITGGAALVLSMDTSVAQDIWAKSLGGDYVVTPSHIEGETPLEFSGVIEEAPPAPQRPSESRKSRATSSAVRRSPSTR